MARPDHIPQAFWDRLEKIVPDTAFDTVRASFHEPRAGSGRVNRLVADASATLESLRSSGLDVTPLTWYPDGFTVPPPQRDALGRSEAARSGRVWLQNPSSMVPPVVLGPRRGERVLDLAAAPGSKTLQLAALMEGDGELAAVEVVRGRFFRLKRNLAAGGAAFVRTFLRDGTTVWRHRPDHFDRVLVDAPCSTEGRFRADEPETFAYWSPAKIRAMVRKQIPLLQSALRSVRRGGTAVYSTCSFAPEENERVIEHVLRWADGSAETCPLPDGLPALTPALDRWDGEPIDPAVRHARRILPDGQYEGFFVCLLRRTGDLPG